MVCDWKILPPSHTVHLADFSGKVKEDDDEEEKKEKRRKNWMNPAIRKYRSLGRMNHLHLLPLRPLGHGAKLHLDFELNVQ